MRYSLALLSGNLVLIFIEFILMLDLFITIEVSMICGPQKYPLYSRKLNGEQTILGSPSYVGHSGIWMDI